MASALLLLSMLLDKQSRPVWWLTAIWHAGFWFLSKYSPALKKKKNHLFCKHPLLLIRHLNLPLLQVSCITVWHCSCCWQRSSWTPCWVCVLLTEQSVGMEATTTVHPLFIWTADWEKISLGHHFWQSHVGILGSVTSYSEAPGFPVVMLWKSWPLKHTVTFEELGPAAYSL